MKTKYIKKAICIKKFIGECSIENCPHGKVHDRKEVAGATCITREGYCSLLAEETNNTLNGDNTHCISITTKIPIEHFKRMGIEVVE